jgi:hypothetical protein
MKEKSIHGKSKLIPQVTSKTYKFSVTQDSDGGGVFAIIQIQKDAGQTVKKRISISLESLQSFHNAYLDAVNQLVVKKKAYNVDEQRKINPNAYKKWELEDDKALTKAYKAGKSLDQLAKSFGRNRGAIESRLSKLGLVSMPHMLESRSVIFK